MKKSPTQKCSCKICTSGRTGKASRKQTGGKWITPTKRNAVLFLDKRCCQLCGRDEVDLKAAKERGLSLDHITCHSHGGCNEVHNLIVVCVRCNTKRGARTLSQWVKLLRNDEALRKELGINRKEVDRFNRRATKRMKSGFTTKDLKEKGHYKKAKDFLAKK